MRKVQLKSTPGRELTDYKRRIVALIAAARRDGVTSLREMVGRLPGVFPLTVAGLMKLPRGRATKHPGAVATAPRSTNGYPPVPHPLDFDWRFSRTAREALVRHVARLSPQPRPVHCFGCPSIWRHLRSAGHAAEVRLFDLNAELHEAGGGWDATRDGPPELAQGVVIADPPWYDSYFRQFLWAVRSACPIGTDLLLAGPPWGTRPGAAGEMHRLMRWAKEVGFAVIAHEEGALPYLTPLFEFNTLSKYGLDDLPLDWRKADLWQLRLARKPPRQGPAQPPPARHWEERRYGPVRIRFQSEAKPGLRHRGLKALGRDGFLSSVSSRDPLRQQANVVTSGGRYFSCQDPLQLLQDSDALMATRLAPMPGKLRGNALSQLLAVIEHETKETEKYHGLVHDFERT